MILIIIFSIVFVLCLITQISIITVYGTFIKKNDIELFMDLDLNDISLNIYDNSMISVRNGSYISKLPFPILAKYQISGYGIVPYFSELHRQINHYYKRLNQLNREQNANR